MQFKFLVLVTVLTLIQGFSTLAEEEAKPEGGEHGGGKEGGGVKIKDPEWVALQNQINQLEGKMQQKKEAIEKLVEEKQHLKEGSPEIKEVIDQMLREYKELQSTTKEFDAKVIVLKYRFPERGLKGMRTYETIELKSLEDMEKELGTDGRLSRNQQKIRSQYNPQSPAQENASEVKKPSPRLENKEKSIDEAGTIILQK